MMAYGTYDKQVKTGADADAQLPTAIVLEAAAGVKHVWTAREPMCITRFGIEVTVAFDYNVQTTEGKVAIYKRPTYGSDTGKVKLAEMALEHGWAAGTIHCVDVLNPAGVADIDAGEQVTFEVITQAAGGQSIAGDYQPYICWHPRAEVAANQPNMFDETP